MIFSAPDASDEKDAKMYEQEVVKDSVAAKLLLQALASSQPCETKVGPDTLSF